MHAYLIEIKEIWLSQFDKGKRQYQFQNKKDGISLLIAKKPQRGNSGCVSQSQKRNGGFVGQSLKRQSKAYCWMKDRWVNIQGLVLGGRQGEMEVERFEVLFIRKIRMRRELDFYQKIVTHDASSVFFNKRPDILQSLSRTYSSLWQPNETSITSFFQYLFDLYLTLFPSPSNQIKNLKKVKSDQPPKTSILKLQPKHTPFQPTNTIRQVWIS